MKIQKIYCILIFAKLLEPTRILEETKNLEEELKKFTSNITKFLDDPSGFLPTLISYHSGNTMYKERMQL